MTTETPTNAAPLTETEPVDAPPNAPAVLYVEVLDRRSRLQMRARVDDLPCTIGRAYGCAVVLDDRFVSPEHIRIRVNDGGALIVEDLNSTNGLHDARTGKLAASMAVTPGTTIRIGQTLLRFHTSDETVAPAVPLPGAFSTPGWIIPLAFVFAFGVGSLSWYLETYSKLTASPFVWGGVVLAFVVFSWAGAWALLSRLLQHQSHFAEHCAVVCSFVPLYILAGWVTDYYAFAFSADRSAALLEWFLPTFITAGLLYGHLRFCSVLPRSQLILRAGTFAGVATALAALLALTESLDPEWTAALSFRGELKPPLFRLVSSEDMEGFFTRVESLRTRVDELAKDAGDATGNGDR